jgi:hypothetical protein
MAGWSWNGFGECCCIDAILKVKSNMDSGMFLKKGR